MIVGFAPEQAAVIKLPLKVQIDAGNVGGPSAGLAFALEVLEDLGHRSTAATRWPPPARSSSNGAVGPIGGIKQKTYGVRAAKADVFLVPVETRADGPPLRAWPADHRCEEFSPGVARAGNTAPEALENGIFGSAGNCRKFVSFRPRQRLLPRGSALVSPRRPTRFPRS